MPAMLKLYWMFCALVTTSSVAVFTPNVFGTNVTQIESPVPGAIGFAGNFTSPYSPASGPITDTDVIVSGTQPWFWIYTHCSTESEFAFTWAPWNSAPVVSGVGDAA